MSEKHDEYCPADLVEHIAAVEAGWTLRKPWKTLDVDAAEAENIREVRDMLARWGAHGVNVLTGATLASWSELDAAWAEAEAALPEGWYVGVQTGHDAAYTAIAANMYWLTESLTGTYCDGDTPAAALRALAARLRERTP